MEDLDINGDVCTEATDDTESSCPEASDIKGVEFIFEF